MEDRDITGQVDGKIWHRNPAQAPRNGLVFTSMQIIVQCWYRYQYVHCVVFFILQCSTSSLVCSNYILQCEAFVFHY